MNSDEKLDFIKINSRWAKSTPKVRKTMSQEQVEQARAKKEQKIKDYYAKQKGRIPD